ncbi:MAG TPA: single-stranded DNA-binding protein [Planctomycetota bacterium]|nr:single-stranded DNA-binding protein [Planctomycetota bacterium]
MPSVNRVTLMGHLARDPELRYTPQGSAVCDFAIGMNRRFKRKDSGEIVNEVTFVDITAWNRTAELCAEYLKKGRLVYVSGALKQERWEERESGAKRSKVKVVAQEVQFIGKGSQDEESEPVPEEDPAPAAEAPAKGSGGAAKSKR